MATWKVRATNPGLYGHLRQPGEEFEITERKNKDGSTTAVDKVFSNRWMERIEADEKEEKKK